MSGGLWLGRATPGDAPRLAALEADCYTQPWTLRQFEEEVGYGPPGAVLVLKSPRPSERWGHVRAYCAYRIAVDELEVLNVAVAPPCRRRGLGRWLLDFSLARGARSGAVRAFLEVRAGNREALALYRGMGFRTLSRRPGYYRQPSEDALVLALDPLPPEEP